jgi:hypothetical protein
MEITTSKEPQMQQFQAVTADDLTFTPAEWADETQQIEVAEIRGYQITIEVEDEGKTFAWSVMATSEVSETPEIIDDSTRWPYKNRGMRQAVRMALVVLNRHLRQREPEARKAERAKKVEEANAEATPQKPKRRRKAAAAA